MLNWTDQPKPGSMPYSTKQPATMADRLTVDPADRSMPAMLMTKVMPMARKAFSATCLVMMTIFAADRKLGA